MNKDSMENSNSAPEHVEPLQTLEQEQMPTAENEQQGNSTSFLTSISEKVKAMPSKQKMTVGVISASVIILLIYLFSGGSASSSVYTNKSIISYHIDDTDYILMNGQKHELDGETRNFSMSLDQSAIAVLTDVDDFGGTLWYITGKEKVKIAEDVKNFLISDNGKGIAYISDYDYEYRSGDLYLYDAGKKKSEKVDSDVFGHIYHLSPNGKSIAYMKDFDFDHMEFTSFIKIDNKSPEKLGNNHIPFAIADKGKYLYFGKLKDDDDIADFYVKRGKDEVRLRSNIDLNYFDAFFNVDYSQIIINDDGRAYLSINGNETVSIGRYELYSPLGQHISHRSWLNRQLKVYSIADLSNTVYYNDSDALIIFDKSGESMTIERRNMQADVGSDAIVFIDQRSRLVKKSLKDLNKEEQILADDVSHFVMSADGSKIYYLDFYDDLFFIKGTSKPKKVAGDVERSTLQLSQDGNTAVYLSDYRRNAGTLYTSKNGGKPERIADDVYSLILAPEGLYYSKDYDSGYFDVYISTNYKKSEKLEQEVEYMTRMFPRNSSDPSNMY